MAVYTEDDRGNALPIHLPVVGSDVEINANVIGDDMMLRVNKAGILVFRVKLEDAAKTIAGRELMNFSTFAPDFVFKIGDSVEGLERLRRAVGLV